MNSESTEKITRIFFVRHGVTSQTGTVLYGRTSGLALSDEGQDQAQAMASFLNDVKIDVVISSPLERAAQTAKAIADRHDLDVEIIEDFIDTDNGIWTNRLMEDCRKEPDWKIIQQTPSQYKFEGGESYIDILDRMDKATRLVVQKYEGKSIVIASHRDPIISLLSSYLGLHLDLFQRIPCDPASMSEVQFINGIAMVSSVNVLPASRMVK